MEGRQVRVRRPTQGDGQVTVATPNLLLLGAEADAKQVSIPGLPALGDRVVADQENLHMLSVWGVNRHGGQSGHRIEHVMMPCWSGLNQQ